MWLWFVEKNAFSFLKYRVEFSDCLFLIPNTLKISNIAHNNLIINNNFVSLFKSLCELLLIADCIVTMFVI